MKLLTRTAFVFLTVFVLVTAAYAAHKATDIAYPVTGGNIYFDKATGTVTGCDKYVRKVSVPEKIEGVSVTSIGEYAFSSCGDLLSAEIPNGVRSIGKGAFQYCENLRDAKIPDNATFIGEYAFVDCSSLTSVRIPNGVTSIEEGTFYGCSSLADVELGENVSNIGLSPFYGCAMTGVKIPDSVVSILNGAFAECANLERVEIPRNVSELRRDTFTACFSLTKIDVAAENADYISLDGVLFKRDNMELICYPAGKSEQFYSVPNGVGSIEDGAFYGCPNLISVKIPDGVTYIGYYSFRKCRSLISVEIPKSAV